MNKKEYLEAARELMEERRINREKAWESYRLFIKIIFTIFAYASWFYLKDTHALQSHLFIWAMGGWLALILCELSDYIDENEKQKEQQK